MSLLCNNLLTVPLAVIAGAFSLEPCATAQATNLPAWSSPSPMLQHGVELESTDDGRGTDYVVNKSDNICGLDEPRQLTKPSKVDYDALLEATPEVKRIHKDKIDPNSSRGITLMTKARGRVLKACESVRSDSGYCSVWKKISRRDKKAISDITDDVKKKISADEEE